MTKTGRSFRRPEHRGAAYGMNIGQVLDRLADPLEVRAAADALDMRTVDVAAAAGRLERAALIAWPRLVPGRIDVDRPAG